MRKRRGAGRSGGGQRGRRGRMEGDKVAPWRCCWDDVTISSVLLWVLSSSRQTKDEDLPKTNTTKDQVSLFPLCGGLTQYTSIVRIDSFWSSVHLVKEKKMNIPQVDCLLVSQGHGWFQDCDLEGKRWYIRKSLYVVVHIIQGKAYILRVLSMVHDIVYI